MCSKIHYGNNISKTDIFRYVETAICTLKEKSKFCYEKKKTLNIFYLEICKVFCLMSVNYKYVCKPTSQNLKQIFF